MDNSTQREPWMALISAMTQELLLTTELKDKCGIDPQFYTRLMVRVFFSTLEGLAFHLKTRALSVGTHRKAKFTDKQLEKLTESKSVQQPDGSITQETSFLPAQANLTFALATFQAVMDVKDLGLGGFPSPPTADMIIGRQVRDRLTHPKHAGSFTIQPDEAKAIGRTAEWLLAALRWYGKVEVGAIERIKEEVSASTQALIASIVVPEQDEKS